MGFSDLWSRTLVYFGIAEDEEWDDDQLQTSEQQLEDNYRRRDRQNVRRLPSSAESEGWDSEESLEPAPRRERSSRLRSVSAPAPAKVHLVQPRAFNDAKQIADRFKAQIPVIINLQSADTELSKRWAHKAWPSARLHAHILSPLPSGTFPGVDDTELYAFLDEHSGDTH